MISGLSAKGLEIASNPAGKIEAIKVHRKETGASLKDAKDAVEMWMQKSVCRDENVKEVKANPSAEGGGQEGRSRPGPTNCRCPQQVVNQNRIFRI